jgi:hypothetical protein
MAKYNHRDELVEDLKELLASALDLAQAIGQIQTCSTLDEAYKVERKGIDVEFTRSLAQTTVEDIHNTVGYLEQILAEPRARPVKPDCWNKTCTFSAACPACRAYHRYLNP